MKGCSGIDSIVLCQHAMLFTIILGDRRGNLNLVTLCVSVEDCEESFLPKAVSSLACPPINTIYKAMAHGSVPGSGPLQKLVLSITTYYPFP